MEQLPITFELGGVVFALLAIAYQLNRIAKTLEGRGKDANPKK